MIDVSNPAGRLYERLKAAQGVPGKTLVREAWATALDCEATSDAEITRRVVELHALTETVETLIRLLPGLNHDLYLASFARLRRALFPLQLGSPWESSRIQLNDDVMTRLQFCANELGARYSEESVSDTDLQQIAETIESLSAVLAQSDIAVDLKMVLMEQVERLRFAVSIYRIKGARGIKDALQALLGAVVANQQPLMELEDKHSDILKRVGTLIDKLDTFTARTLKVYRILSAPVRAALAFLGNSGDALPSGGDDTAG